MTHQRHYTRVATEHTETITVNVDDTGRIRMTADNLHDVLIHLGFTRTDLQEQTP